MKKIILSLLCGALALQASAQTWQDALFFSENNYGGTARSVGLGNAMTALGGDPGSLTFNPAGSAVSSYSQVFFTPGLSISSAQTKGISEADGKLPVGLGDKVSTGYTRFKIPNGGIILYFPSGNRHGYQGSSMGILFNSTADYTSRLNAAGINQENSFSGSLASSARGFNYKVLENEDWFYDGDDPTRLPAYADMAGYRGGLFNAVIDEDGKYTGDYVAVTDVLGGGKPGLAAPIYQKYGQQTKGFKSDILFNYAMNWDDKFYVGANIGIVVLNYGFNEYWYEEPDDPNEFPLIKYNDGTTARFQSLEMKHSLNLKGTGAYFKLGAIWRPVGGLRLGAAIQTPTLINLKETYAYSAETQLTGRYLSPIKTPEFEWVYALSSPFRFNAGIAYTIGKVAALSFDYELSDFGSARFRTRSEDSYAEGSFGGVNRDIRDALGAGQTFRAGVEIKPVSFLAFRAGYNYITSPQRAFFDGDKVVKFSFQERASMAQHQVSAGAGLSLGAFYADLATRVRLVPSDYLIPYQYMTYQAKPEEFYRKVVDLDVITPAIKTDWTFVNVLLTLGWRF